MIVDAVPRRLSPLRRVVALACAYPRVTLVFALGLVLRAVLLPITFGPDFHIWDLTAAATLHGQDVYAHPPLDPARYGPYAYFPLYLYLLLPLKWLALHSGLSYVALGKLPVVAGDVGVALGLASALRRAGRDERACATGVALYFLNPLVLYNGAFYGRFDSLPLALLLLAWNRLSPGAGGRSGRLALPFSLAVALKTFPIFLLPYLIARLGRRRGGRLALATVLTPLVIALPYLLHDARRFLYIVFVYDSTKGPRQFSWQVILLNLGLSERAATVVSYGLLALFALAIVLPVALRSVKSRALLAPLAHGDWPLGPTRGPTVQRASGGAWGDASPQTPANHGPWGSTGMAIPNDAQAPTISLKGQGRMPRLLSPTARERRAEGVTALADPYVYAAVVFTLFLLLSKVVYEQYLLWPLPFLAVLAVRDRARDAVGLLVTLSVIGLSANQWLHPFGYNPYPALWLNVAIAVAVALFVVGRVVAKACD